MNADEALKIVRSAAPARVQLAHAAVMLANEVVRLRERVLVAQRGAQTQVDAARRAAEMALVDLGREVERLREIEAAARRYSVATRDPGGEADDVRKARHRECNLAWRDLNDALAR